MECWICLLDYNVFNSLGLTQERERTRPPPVCFFAFPLVGSEDRFISTRVEFISARDRQAASQTLPLEPSKPPLSLSFPLPANIQSISMSLSAESDAERPSAQEPRIKNQ